MHVCTLPSERTFQEEIVMSKANNSQIAALPREMAAVGTPVDLSAPEAELEVEIEQIGGVCDSMFFA